MGGVSEAAVNSPDEPETTSTDVLAFLDLVGEAGASVWLDGGWGVDALLGTQSRRHGDLDIVVELRWADALVGQLQEMGYVETRGEDARAWNFVLGHAGGAVVDFHVIVLDEAGNGIYGPAVNGETYPAASLRGVGTVRGRRVHCISPEWMVAFHTGYPLDDKDWADVSALCERFRLPIPPDYRRWQAR